MDKKELKIVKEVNKLVLNTISTGKFVLKEEKEHEVLFSNGFVIIAIPKSINIIKSNDVDIRDSNILVKNMYDEQRFNIKYYDATLTNNLVIQDSNKGIFLEFKDDEDKTRKVLINQDFLNIFKCFDKIETLKFKASSEIAPVQIFLDNDYNVGLILPIRQKD